MQDRAGAAGGVPGLQGCSGDEEWSPAGQSDTMSSAVTLKCAFNFLYRYDKLSLSFSFSNVHVRAYSEVATCLFSVHYAHYLV